MLTESEIIAAVCRHLKKHGWKIVSICNELQRGDDIVAEHRSSGQTAVIEAKGETSSKPTSRRHGKPFSSAQVTSHVSRAFYRAAQTVNRDRLSAMALPRTALHIDRMRRIEPVPLAMRRLLLILMTLSLSWVTVGYACSVSGAVAQLACCCDSGSSHSCPDPSRACSSSSMLGGPGDGCCSPVTTSATSLQAQGNRPGKMDLTLFDRPTGVQAVARPPQRVSGSAQPRALASSVAPLYLLIGHLLR